MDININEIANDLADLSNNARLSESHLANPGFAAIALDSRHARDC